MPVLITTATKEDAELIADLSRQTFYEAFAPQNTKENMDKFMNEVFTKQGLMEEVGAKDNIFYLAMQDQHAVGYVRMRLNNQPPELSGRDSIEIARIYAVSDSIGKGVGRLLMQRCLETAMALKKDTIWLGVWEHN